MIRIENLVKTFGAKRAVDGISFGVERGEVLGFLGPNGSGKSTTMRMITCFYPPTSGRVTVGGHDVVEDGIAAKRLIGYLPENAASYPDMTVQGFLNFVAELRGLKGRARRKAVERVIELCFLESVLHQSIDTLSKGYKHRTCLAQALVHDPQVLIMDEPTTALDVVVQREILQQVEALKRDFGFAVLFITHDVSLLLEFADRIAIMYAGEIVETAPAERLASNPQHPYTQGLLHSFPPLTGPRVPLTGIPGSPPDLRDLPTGCRFHPRCPHCLPEQAELYRRQTTERPRLRVIEQGHEVACHLVAEGLE
jgi:oligopeptide/dipeptide ABC transporter ATP-binding protein